MKDIVVMLIIFVLLVAAGNGRFLQETSNSSTEGPKPLGPSQYCDFFQMPNPSRRGFPDTPCEGGEGVDERGNCNTTHHCKEDNHCYVGWRNESGVVTIVSSGCWDNYKDCSNVSECRANKDFAAKGVYFCCCLGDFCGRELHLDPAINDDEDIVATTDPVTVESTVNVIALSVGLVAGFVILGVIIFVRFFWWRRKKRRDVDGISMETPAGAATRCTNVSPFPVNMECPSPHLLAVKARGRFGKVWRAELEDRIVAVKTFNLSEKSSWQNEQDIFCTPLMNTHPNILKFHTASSRGEGMHSELWLITEFYDRGSLADYLKVHKVTFDEALQIIQTMASGLSFLHEDIQGHGHESKPAIAHRDFKSKNVLLDQNLNAVIADFGLAVKFLPGESPGESHGQVGTLRYMAPEVLEGAINFQKDAFLRIDMYAFGLVMWEILMRCSSLPGCGEYKMPFEDELGTNPTIDYMQEFVVDKKLRPVIKEEWKMDREVSNLCETVDECWDHDAEARLSAGCVEQRVKNLRKNRQNEMILQTPHIVNVQNPSSYTDTDTMNEKNIRMSNINSENKNQEQPGNGPPDADRPAQRNKDDSKMQNGACTYRDDDHDSGTFANDDTLSHDGAMDPLVGNEIQNAESQITLDDDNDSATSLLTPDDDPAA